MTHFYADDVSGEELDWIRHATCDHDDGSLVTARCRALWNEIERLRSALATQSKSSIEIAVRCQKHEGWHLQQLDCNSPRTRSEYIRDLENAHGDIQVDRDRLRETMLEITRISHHAVVIATPIIAPMGEKVNG